MKYNEIDPKKWREYADITTDSLWIINKRDNSGAHSGDYHGNFVPQVPRQLFSRYTKKGDWILDPFVGCGTSLIEAQRMGRNSIGIDLSLYCMHETLINISKERNDECITDVFAGDSRFCDIGKWLEPLGVNKVQFVIMHPPYWDIIKFSSANEDLSNAHSLKDFLVDFGKVIQNTTKYLEMKRYCACVMGDKYANGEVIPLGFKCMNLFLDMGFALKAIIVKNFGETKGKANQQGLWRYRALVNDFYVFKHEYIFVFKKVNEIC